MYIKLTRMSGVPIWFNAAFIVTVEPAPRGGSTVVPIGDGLDYDVRETPEQVLAMLAGAPAPTVVPVPAPRGLTKTPDDVSPEPERAEPASEPAPAPAAKKTAHTRKAKSVKAPAPADDAGEFSAPPVAPASVADEAPAAPAPASAEGAFDPFAGIVGGAVATGLDEERMARLRRLAPRSLRKLSNTLASQFKVSDPEGTIHALVEANVIALDKDRVLWKA